MRSRFLAVVAVAALSASVVGSVPEQPDVSEKAIVAAASQYIASYQELLTAVLADETYAQHIVEQIPDDPDMPRRRRMSSEIFFMFAPVRRDWMTVRDVIAVDGKAIENRPDFQQALRTLPFEEVAASFRKQNARYNIGRTFRNFNEPTLGLLVLDERQRSRFAFDRARVERSGDVTLVTLRFEEKERPTLIRNVDGRHVFLMGELIVEAGSGRVHRTKVNGRIDDMRIELTTNYEPNQRLDMWVPSRFAEEYEHGVPPRGWSPKTRRGYERILCEASYTNFRRFGTSVKVK